ncbi:hypothetical protein DEO72_LG9g2358 [Vigna unguiculata]|uniref:Uncharacterized protein n=1 Tax=Vigna unguiculata TaxID=3917 RepID=A0A4D6N4D7_VIGUN|nr:hypothetical protein DEO72_LG9g2358 [Vigna unguiculata]
MCQTFKNRVKTKPECILAQPLAQAERSRSGERVSRSGELLSPRQKLEKWETAFSRLGEASSPERDRLSLKTGARRLSDSSRNQPGRVAANHA